MVKLSQKEQEKVSKALAEEEAMVSSCSEAELTDELSGTSEDDDGFEDQGSSSEEEEQNDSDSEVVEKNSKLIQAMRKRFITREEQLRTMEADGSLAKAKVMHVDDLSSDDEEVRNTVGNVPLRWYEDYEHIGYDIDGKKITKSSAGDRIDAAIAARDDPNYSRTVYDAYNDRNVVLSDRDLEIIRRMQSGAFAHPECHANPDYVDYYSSQKMIHSFGNDYEPKSRFIPSKWERMRVLKIMKGIKEGRIRTDKVEQDKKKDEVHAIWDEVDENAIIGHRKGPQHVAAPKLTPPGHGESYNPPEEYLMTEEEEKAWKEMDPSERETNFIPKKFTSFRAVSGYEGFVRERFERCLDLYLCPRVQKKRLNIDPESLVPELPKPRDLRPFPNTLAFKFKGHTGHVRSLSMDPKGQYVASGSDDCTVRIWEVDTCRCVAQYRVGHTVHKVAWNPNPDHSVLAVAAGKHIFLIATGISNPDVTELTEAFLSVDETIEVIHNLEEASVEKEEEEDVQVVVLDETEEALAEKQKRSAVKWKKFESSSSKSGIRLVLTHQAIVKDMNWHKKGDYLSAVVPKAVNNSAAVVIHQVSKKKSQTPFGNKKNMGQVQAVVFHPTKPFLFHATQRQVRIYNLMQQQMIKKLVSGVKWISSMSVHPSGDHLVIGSYDRRVCWFDLDLSSSPFKTLKYHEKAIRDVVIHAKAPLMASASDDGTIHVFHSMVYSDLAKNPLLVPLKILRGHQVSSEGLGVLSVAFHPTQPWLCSGGADGDITLFQSIH